MTCNGSPGNPGVERIPDADGGWNAACLGCSACSQTPITSFDDPRLGIRDTQARQARKGAE